MNVQRPWPAIGVGWIFALIGLILTIVFWAVGTIAEPAHVAVLFVLAFLALLL